MGQRERHHCNRHQAALSSLWTWAVGQGYMPVNVVGRVERRKERRTARQDAQARAIHYARLEAVWSRPDVAVREKGALWRPAWSAGAR